MMPSNPPTSHDFEARNLGASKPGSLETWKPYLPLTKKKRLVFKSQLVHSSQLMQLLNFLTCSLYVNFFRLVIKEFWREKRFHVRAVENP